LSARIDEALAVLESEDFAGDAELQKLAAELKSLRKDLNEKEKQLLETEGKIMAALTGQLRSAGFATPRPPVEAGVGAR